MRTGIAVAVAVVALVAAVIFEAPASLLDARLASISQGRVRIANAAGTLWHGSGDLVLSGRPHQGVAWQIDPWPLLHGELRGSLKDAASSRPIASFDAGGDHLELRGVDFALPMEALLKRSARRRSSPPPEARSRCTPNGSRAAPMRSTRSCRCSGRTPVFRGSAPIASLLATCARSSRA